MSKLYRYKIACIEYGDSDDMPIKTYRIVIQDTPEHAMQMLVAHFTVMHWQGGPAGAEVIRCQRSKAYTHPAVVRLPIIIETTEDTDVEV